MAGIMLGTPKSDTTVRTGWVGTLEACFQQVCPRCKKLVQWATSQQGAVEELSAAHPACGLNFIVAVKSVITTVTDPHGNPIIVSQGRLVYMPDAPAPRPPPAPELPTVDMGGGHEYQLLNDAPSGGEPQVNRPTPRAPVGPLEERFGRLEERFGRLEANVERLLDAIGEPRNRPASEPPPFGVSDGDDGE